MSESFYSRWKDSAVPYTQSGTPQTSPPFLKVPYARNRNQLEEMRPDIAIIGEPWDGTVVCKPGTRYGPQAIRSAMALYGAGDPILPICFNIEMGIDPFASLKVVDYGDVAVVPGETVETHNRMTAKVSDVLELDATPIILGGDHSGTFANVRAFAKKFGDIGIIHIDAHADTATGEDGCKWEHSTWARRVYEDGYVKGKNYTLIGLRGYWPGPGLFKWMQQEDFQWFTSLDVEELGVEAIGKEAVERAIEGTEAVWITWDVDVFDPAFAPGTTIFEPNGMTSREGIKLMRVLSKSFDVGKFGFDLMEVCPPLDVGEIGFYEGGVTSMLASRLILELLQGLALKKQHLNGGSPIRPKEYRGKDRTYEF